LFDPSCRTFTEALASSCAPPPSRCRPSVRGQGLLNHQFHWGKEMAIFTHLFRKRKETERGQDWRVLVGVTVWPTTKATVGRMVHAQRDVFSCAPTLKESLRDVALAYMHGENHKSNQSRPRNRIRQRKDLSRVGDGRNAFGIGGMDTLPVEIVAIIVIDHVPMAMRPALLCVSTLWRSIVVRGKSACARQTRSMTKIPALAPKAQGYRHACTTSRRCAIHYAKLAIDKGWWDIVEWMLDCLGPFGSINDTHMYACERAALDGNVALMEKWTARGDPHLCHVRAWERAARSGHLGVLEYMHHMNRTHLSDGNVDKKVVRAAAKGGHLHVVQWLRERQCRWHFETLWGAVKRGHFDTVRWLIENGCPWGTTTMATAIMSGRMDLVQWLNDHGCKRGDYGVWHAARMGRLDMLEWLHANGHVTDSWASAIAAREGHLEVLVWLHAHGGTLLPDVCDSAAEGGHMHVVQWAHANGYPWNAIACASAAERNHLDVLKWMREQGCAWDERVCDGAMMNGNMEMLQWARANGCPWDKHACAHAARDGRLDMLRWARNNGCPWSATACAAAAEGGHLDILQWARTSGCPWDARTCARAAQYGHLRVLHWARANNCPWDNRTCLWATSAGQVEVLEWALDNGCPHDNDALYRIGCATGHIELRGFLQARKDLALRPTL